MGIAVTLVVWPRHYELAFVPPPPWKLYMSIGLAFLEQVSFDKRTTAYPISFFGAFGSGELNIV